MRYSAFLALGVLLIVAQGETHLLLGSLSTRGFTPSLLVPLLVFLGVTESNLALGAGVAFLLGYVLDVVGGAPIGLHAFTSVATFVLARVAGVRIVAQGGVARALLAGGFATFESVLALVLLAIFGKPYVPRALLHLVLPRALATVVVAPVVFRAAARVQAFVGGVLDPTRQASPARRSGAASPGTGARRVTQGMPVDRSAFARSLRSLAGAAAGAQMGGDATPGAPGSPGSPGSMPFRTRLAQLVRRRP